MTALRTWLSVFAEGREFRVEPGSEWLVGRADEADLQIMDALVSRMHAVVHHVGDGWRVTDLGSANGIWRDGTRVAHTTVSIGPVTVRLGGPDGPSLQLVPGPTGEWRDGSDTTTAGGSGPDSGDTSDDTVPLVPRVPRRAPATATPRTLACHDLSRGALRIGRSLSNGIVLADLLVSREHAKVWLGADGATLLDLDSGNGTYVNGRRVRRCRLADGDLISIGPYRLRYEGECLHELDASGGPDFAAAHLSVTVEGGKRLLHDVSFSLPPRTLMAIVGPSGAGKSTLLHALSGLRPATSGQVFYGGRDLYGGYGELRQRIGFVPQQDILHRVLTVEQALGFGARLRFPAETTAQERAARVREVAAELRLTGQLGTRIDRLSGGERKRASTAMELVTRPDLLFLDEPTSGLDIDLDREVMQQLRTLADDGRTVVVVTHNLEHLADCDVVLVLTAGGRTAYLGPPGGVFAHFGVATWADVFAVMKTREPAEWAAAFVAAADRDPRSFPPRDGDAAAAPRSGLTHGEPEPPPRRSLRDQFATMVRRQLAVTVADRALLAILTALPAALALMTLGVRHRSGLSRIRLNDEAPQLLLILVMGAALMGSAGTIRELVKERTIYLRERAVGVSWAAYLLSKVAVFTGITAVQGLVLGVLAQLGRKGPVGPLVLPWSIPEIAVVVAGVAVASAMVGLMVSALVRDENQAMPVLVLMTMGQLVVSGGVIPVADTAGLRELSWLLPARWGFAATAATVDLQYMRPELPPDSFWNHGSATWWADLAGLLVLTLVTLAVTAVLLRSLDPRRPDGLRTRLALVSRLVSRPVDLVARPVDLVARLVALVARLARRSRTRVKSGTSMPEISRGAVCPAGVVCQSEPTVADPLGSPPPS